MESEDLMIFEVSIHLMLLFIHHREFQFKASLYVSIHLMLLFISFWAGWLFWRSLVSIHLMLLFIRDHMDLPNIRARFQYISCYSLSDTMRGEISMLNKFQYISCYSLSNKEIEHVSGEVMFQYISCYSLSWNKVFRLEENISFNTSHVTLYQRLVHQNDCNALVSIHLMLLFIARFIISKDSP